MNVPAKWSKRRMAYTLLLTIWFLKFIFGLTATTGGHASIYPDAARGFPSPYMGDIGFYIVVPAGFAVLNLLMLVFASKFPRWPAIVAMVLQFFLLLMLFFFGTGGI